MMLFLPLRHCEKLPFTVASWPSRDEWMGVSDHFPIFSFYTEWQGEVYEASNINDAVVPDFTTTGYYLYCLPKQMGRERELLHFMPSGMGNQEEILTELMHLHLGIPQR